MPLPNQLPKLNFQGVDPTFQQWLNQLADTVNSHSGYNGPVALANHLDLRGNQVKNIGAPTAPTDALASGIAEQSYSASALKPEFESSGSSSLNTYRQLNNGTQRESRSSWLNDLMSTVPNANQIVPYITEVVGAVQVTIPTSPFQFADGSSTVLHGRTDLLSFPAEYSITSISVSGNVVTAVFSYTGTAPNIVAGNAGTITGVTPSSYNGTYEWTSAVTDTVSLTVTVQYQSSTASGSASGGSVQENGVWYYLAKKGSSDVYLLGSFSGDTLTNRLQANFDGAQIVAVVVITADGGQVGSSGGGGSAIVGSPTAGSFF